MNLNLKLLTACGVLGFFSSYCNSRSASQVQPGWQSQLASIVLRDVEVRRWLGQRAGDGVWTVPSEKEFLKKIGAPLGVSVSLKQTGENWIESGMLVTTIVVTMRDGNQTWIVQSDAMTPKRNRNWYILMSTDWKTGEVIPFQDRDNLISIIAKLGDFPRVSNYSKLLPFASKGVPGSLHRELKYKLIGQSLYLLDTKMGVEYTFTDPKRAAPGKIGDLYGTMRKSKIH